MGEGVGENVPKEVGPAGPGRAVLTDPAFDRLHRLWLEPTSANPTDLLAVHEAAALQDVQVLHDGRQRNAEGRRELAHGRGAAGQPLDHRTALAVGEGLEDAV